MFKRTSGEKAFSVINYTVLSVLALTAIYPFVYTLSMSLSTTKEAMRIGLHLYPREISVTAYNMVFKNKDIFISYGNTIFRTVVGTIAALLVTTLFAYALSHKEMPNKKVYTSILLFTMLFNGGTIPTYLVLKELKLIDSMLVYILPNLIGAYNVIIAKSFFESIPESLRESARMDGASEFRIYFKIIMPLSKPVIMTLALWIAVFHWNSWYDAMMYITSSSKIVLQLFLQKIILENQSDIMKQGLINPNTMTFTPETIKSATIIVTILPILMFYPFIQKYFMKGVMLGAVKG